MNTNTHEDLLRSTFTSLLEERYTLARRHERLLLAVEDLLWFKNLKTFDPVIYSSFKAKKEEAWKALEKAARECRAERT